MKHFIKLLSFLVLINFNIKSQSGWIQIDTDIDQGIKELKFINELTGFAISFNKIYITTNGGYNWQVKFTAPENTFLNSIFLIDENKIRVSGREFIHIYEFAKIFISNNQGNSWEQKNLGGNTSGEDIYFINSITGYMASGFIDQGIITNGTILKTTNGGSNWFSISNDSASNQYTYYSKVFFLNEQTGWVGGYFGPDAGDGAFRLLKTTNGGINWFFQINQTGNTNHNFGDMVFFHDGTGYIQKNIYPINRLLKTTDFGDSWVEIELNTRRFKFINKNTGWFTNSEKEIFRTTNGATSWEHQFTSLYHLNGIDFINALTGYIFGVESLSNYKIFKTTSGGVTSININNNLIPSHFLLHQNYPNPFNPSTTITYSLKENSDVTLKVFDVSGKLVETLVNEKQNAGEYNFQLSIDKYQLGSGVYFYQLSANDFVQTRKMVLIK